MEKSKAIMQDMYGDDIKIGDKIRAIVRSGTENHILNCWPNFKIDLSEPVTVHKDKRGVLMAGKISLKSYKNRLIELVNSKKMNCGSNRNN